MKKFPGMEPIRMSTCATCNVALDDKSIPIFNTTLSNNGPLSDVLKYYLQLPDDYFQPKLNPRICKTCHKSYEDLVDLETKYHSLKTQLWNNHKDMALSILENSVKDVSFAKKPLKPVIENSEQCRYFPENSINKGNGKESSPIKTNVFTICQICGKWFKGKKIPKKHTKIHDCQDVKDESFDQPYSNTCKYCKAEFTDSKDMRQHLKKHVTDCFLYKCRVCDVTLTSEHGAIYHAKVHDKSVDGQFNIENAFDTTLLDGSAVDGVDLDVFDTAEYESSDEEPLSELVKKNQTVKQEDLLDENKIKTEELVPDEKPLSGKKKTAARRSNKRIGLTKEEKLLKVNNAEMEEIILPPIREPKYKCPFCDKMWKTKGELNAHKLSHSDARPFICEICGQAYKHKHALDVHVRMHKGIYEHQCRYCFKAFTQKGALQRHLPIHTGEMPYQCELCGKRFVHRTSFSIHTLAHTGKRHIRCEVCNLGVLSKSHLRRHMRIHSGEKPFECQTCGKTFAERYNLVAHQRIHDPNLPGPRVSRKKQHTCRICYSTFPSKLKMEEHMVSQHSKVEDDNRQNIFETSEPYIQPSKYIMDPDHSPKLEIAEDSSKSQTSPIEVPRRGPQSFQRLDFGRSGTEGSVVRFPGNIVESGHVWTFVNNS